MYVNIWSAVASPDYLSFFLPSSAFLDFFFFYHYRMSQNGCITFNYGWLPFMLEQLPCNAISYQEINADLVTCGRELATLLTGETAASRLALVELRSVTIVISSRYPARASVDSGWAQLPCTLTSVWKKGGIWDWGLEGWARGHKRESQ